MPSIDHKMALFIYVILLISALYVTASSETIPQFKPSDLKLPAVSDVAPQTTSIETQAHVANKVSKQMQAIQAKLYEFSQILNKKKEDPNTPPIAQDCINNCNEVIDAAIEDIKKSLESLGSQNIDQANFDVTAISTNIDTCSECFAEMGENEPMVKKMDEWVRGITNEALGSLDNASR
ncbi:RNA-directed DNA polymerase, eukaryota [Tanacetum coccineum]